MVPGGGTSIDRVPLIQPWAGGTSQKGSLNSGGSLTPADAAIALQIAVGSREYDPELDINNDGSVTSLDALMILQAASVRLRGAAHNGTGKADTIKRNRPLQARPRPHTCDHRDQAKMLPTPLLSPAASPRP